MSLTLSTDQQHRHADLDGIEIDLTGDPDPTAAMPAAVAGPALGHAPPLVEPDLRAPSGVRPIRGAMARWFSRLGTEHPRLSAIVVAIGLSPLLVLLGDRVARFTDDPILTIYGISVLAGLFSLMYLALARYRDPAVGVAPLAPDDQPLVSMIVPVYNDERVIGPCIESLLRGTYENLEILVVDDASTDGTAAVVDAFDDPRVRVWHLEENVGKKRACLVAAREAAGAYFAFTDSDCILAPDALERCVASLVADPELGAMNGHGRALNADANLLTRIQDVWYDSQFSVRKAAESVFGTVTCVSGPLAVYRREAVRSYLPAWASDRFAGAPFLFATDRQLTASVLGQDVIGTKLRLAHLTDPLVTEERVEPRRWNIGYTASARVWTEVPEGVRVFLRQQIRWKKSFIRNLFFNGPWMWRRGVGPALLYYTHAAWVLVAPIMVFRHLIWYPLHGALALTVLYLAGITMKGLVWAAAYRVHNPGCPRWIYRPIMSLISSVVLGWLLLWSALTIRRSIWARGTR